MKKPTPLAERWPCVIAHSRVRGSVDPWISQLWLRMIGGKVPFGDLRNQWRKHHCRTLNPYGSDTCPYQPDDCVTAFAQSAEVMIRAQPRSPVGYFMKVAKMSAAKRADEKPLTRDRWKEYLDKGTNVPASEEAPAPRSGYTGNEAEGIQQGQGVRRPAAGPIGIGELLGTLDVRPRELAPDERKESAE
jgi:hypothetical protein